MAVLTADADSAHCFVQPVLVGGATSGKVSLDQIRDAASEIVSRCAFRPSSGGVAENIGTSLPCTWRGTPSLSDQY